VSVKQRITTAEVILYLRDRLDNGIWQAQERLPAERDLAILIGCSRATLRRALRDLEIEGLIWRHHGKGTFVGSAPHGLNRPLERVIETASIRDLIEARLVYEPALAAAAAENASPDDIALMRRLAQQTGEARDWRDYETRDDAFHKSIAQASGNPLLIAIYANLVSLRGRAVWQRQHDAVFRLARRLEYSTAQSSMHLAVVDAITAHDGAAAHAAMSAHLRAIRDLLAQSASSPNRG